MATTEFMDAAKAQSKTLGLEPGIVWVEHPIQNRSGAELEAIADGAVDGILETIVEGGRPT